MDYRSLYLHFENACLLINTEMISDIRAAFDETLSHPKKSLTRRFEQE
jgi:phosphatidylserine/phosphatidylglycerophosphate/cardiolipin synthase-like enzyme